MSDSTENTSKPSREQLEARVVAMLLGEASPFEEEQLREHLKGDAVLAKFCDEIEQTLPLLNEALDVGQARKAKSPKQHLDRKRRNKLKLLFRSDPGLARRNITRLDFRKVLAIAAAVCAVLFVTAGLLLPSLAKSNDGLNVAVNSKQADQFGERAETEEELRADVADVENYARVKGAQVVNETMVPYQTVAPSASAPLSSRDHVSGKVGFLAGSIVKDREGIVLYDESVDEAAPVSVEAGRLTATTGVRPERGKPVGGRSEGRAHNRSQIASKRELADLALPELQSEDRAESPDEFANYGMYAGFQQNVEKEGSNRSLNELKSDITAKTAESVALLEKKLVQQPAQRTSGPAEFALSPDAVTMSGTGRLSINSLQSVSEAKRSRADEWFKKAPLPGGMGGGGFVAGAYADGLVVGQSAVMGGGSAGTVFGGIAGAHALGFDVDLDGEAEEDGKLYGFGGGQAAQNSPKSPGSKANRRYFGRSTLESTESELGVVVKTLSIDAAGEVASESLNGQIARGFAVDKSAQLGKGLERDQSGAVPLYFRNELSRAETSAPAEGTAALGIVAEDEVANENGQLEVPTLGEVPALGRSFKKGADPEKAARDLSTVQLERSADVRTLSERGRASGESARQSQSLAKQDKDVLPELPVDEYEALSGAIDERLAVTGSARQQRLADKGIDESGKSPATRQPKSLTTANRELLRRKGKSVANKKLPASAGKPQSASRSSRLRDAKQEGEKLVEKLKEAERQTKPSAPSVVYTPRPETVTAENNFSTFSLNVSDVSFKTALASLEANKLPEPGDVRSEEFLNALEYRDPMPRAGEPLVFHWERARSPFTYDRDIIRFSVLTAGLGRQRGRAINLVCLLDNSGSMEREDRASIVRQSLDVLARKLTPNDRVSLITFSRTPKLRIDGLRGGNREAFLKASTGWIPQGGTDIGSGLNLAYATAKKHFVSGGNNRVILLTDGAANMGNVDPYQLRRTVESHRKQGIALDCFGIGWEGYNDNLLEVLARNGDGRYGFLNQPAEAVAEFEQKLLGAFQVAASDVKVQVEWNADRVRVFRQVGYLRHQLKKEDFQNNKIDAAEISAAESGNALYVVQVDPGGQGPLGVVRVRYKVPFTREYTELEWSLAYESAEAPLEQASPALRLCSVAATFAEWLAQNPYAQGVQLADLQGLISGIPSIYGTDSRPRQLEWMIGKARLLTGN